MNKFYVRATEGAVPSVKFEFLSFYKIKIYTDEKIYLFAYHFLSILFSVLV